MSVQTIIAPDGSELVILARADYDRLIEAAEDGIDLADAKRVLADLETDGTMPDAVMGLILDGKSPVAAWREYRGMSQGKLAAKAGITQAAVARIEKAGGEAGREDTRRRLADALDAPLWALSPMAD